MAGNQSPPHSVTFNQSPPHVYDYTYFEDVYGMDSTSLRESSKRSVRENYIKDLPKSTLTRFRDAFKSFSQHDVCVVFGDLGRRPHLLTYMLDFYFTLRESVGVQCRDPAHSPYHVSKDHKEPLDYLFIIEPVFGDTIHRPAHVKHLVVLTSHLSLFNLPASVIELRLSGNVVRPPVVIQQRTTATPDPYHEDPCLLTSVHLDVTKSKSGHDAFLRILTGRDQLDGCTNYSIGLTSRDRMIIQSHVTNTVRVQRERGMSVRKDDEPEYF